MRYDPTRGPLAGIPAVTLQGYLSQAQAAYAALMSGAKTVNVSYTQGDGARAVTYTPASAPQLQAYIMQLQATLGLVPRPRRAIGVRFR